MAIIPGEEQYSGIPSARSGRVIAQQDTSARWQGLAQLGQGVADYGKQVGVLAEKVAAKRIETQTYDTESRYQQFRFNEAKRFSEDMRNVPAGGAAAYAENWTAGYRDRARQFFTTVPEQLRGDYDVKLFATEREFFANGLEFEQSEMRRYSVEQTETTLNNAILPQVVAAQNADNPQTALDAAIRSGTEMINTNPYLTPPEKDEAVQAWRERAQRAFVEGLPAEDRAGWLGTEPTDIADRIIEIESGGQANAANPNSSAYGPGQFIEETWLGLLSRYRPDIADNPEFDRAGLLALRSDPTLAREMVINLTAENTDYLQNHGIAATPANVYLAHFLGPAGAVAVLSADPRMNMSSLVSDDAIAANRSIMEGKTAADVIAWATDKMAGTHGTTTSTLDAIPYEDRQTLTTDAAAQVVRETNARNAANTAAYNQQLNTLLVGVHDGTFGLSAINDARRSWLRDYDDITRVENAFKEANKTQLDLAGALRNFDNPDHTFSQWEETDRDQVDLVYNSLGGTDNLLTGDDPQKRADAMARLLAVTDRAEVLPRNAVAQLRSGIYSADESIRTSAFTVLDGLYRAHPALVENTLNEQDLTRLQRYQEFAPMTTPEMLNNILNPSQDPRDVAQRNQLRADARPLAAAVPTATILDAFDPNVLPGNQPLEPLEPGMQGQLRRDFEALFAENYALSGNADSAQRLALQGLAMKWGSTDIGPRRRLMPYPPEQHYPPVNGNYEWMDTDLRTYVEEQYGTDTQDWGVVPSMATEANLDPRTTPDGVTHYTPYDIWVLDGDGVVRVEHGFEFDYKKYHDEARVEFDRQRENNLRDQRFDQLFLAPADAQLVPGDPLAGTARVPIVPGTGNVPIEYNEFGIPVTRGTPTTQQQADAEYRQLLSRNAVVEQRGILFRERARVLATTPGRAGTTPVIP